MKYYFCVWVGGMPAGVTRCAGVGFARGGATPEKTLTINLFYINVSRKSIIILFFSIPNIYVVSVICCLVLLVILLLSIYSLWVLLDVLLRYVILYVVLVYYC